MTAITFENQSPPQPASQPQSFSGWLRQRIMAYREMRKLKAQLNFLRSLDSRQLMDIGIDPASVGGGKTVPLNLVPYMVVISASQKRV